MLMTEGQRALTVAAMGLMFLATPVKASLGTLAPHLQVVRLVALKGRMIASWYGKEFQGKKTASGEPFDRNKLTAAHKTLPLGSLVILTAKETGKSVLVRINDRGPWIKGRDLDLSEAAATQLGIHGNGIAAVEATLFQSGLARVSGTRR